MKVAITGHTSGIGQALFYAVGNGVGFSRSNSWNINNSVDRQKIIEQITDCDVFVNNAFDGYGQCNMLFEVWKEWFATDKLIINIGSDVTKYSMSTKRLEILDYYNYKIALKELHERLQNLNTSVKMKYVSFGYVATEKTIENGIPQRMTISVDNAVEQIMECINESRIYM